MIILSNNAQIRRTRSNLLKTLAYRFAQHGVSSYIECHAYIVKWHASLVSCQMPKEIYILPTLQQIGLYSVCEVRIYGSGSHSESCTHT